VGAESVALSLVSEVESVEEVDDSFESSPPQLAKTRREINAVVANFFVVIFMMVLR
jgi:hypothetical protein